MRDVMLTTVDNPYNPFKNYDQWLSFDMNNGYNTLGYLDRLCPFSPELSDELSSKEYEEAMDRIIFWNPMIYKKIYEV